MKNAYLCGIKQNQPILLVMEKLYADKGKMLKTIGKYMVYTLIGFLILYLINFITQLFINYIVAPHILVAPAFIVLITIFRNIILLKKPEIIIDEEGLRYLSYFKYDTYLWSGIVDFKYLPTENNLELSIWYMPVPAKIDTSLQSGENIELLLQKIATNKSTDPG